MATQVLFFDVFFEKDPYLNAVEEFIRENVVFSNQRQNIFTSDTQAPSISAPP